MIHTPEYPRTEWAYLKSGILIVSDQAGLIHYIQPEQSFDRSNGNKKPDNVALYAITHGPQVQRDRCAQA
jgi:hypothetical protein